MTGLTDRTVGRRDVLRIRLVQILGVCPRYHQRVPPGRGVDVHEGDGPLILGDDLGGQLPREDPAEEAVGGGR